MPMLRGGRPLKRWTWVGAFGPDVMLCAAVARVGPVTSAWWAVWMNGSLRERTLRRALDVTASRVVVPGAMTLDVAPAGEPVEVVSPHGSQYAWTRKLPVLVRGFVLGRSVEARGLVDESAGYHARHTAWWWSAGVSGDATWNFTDGMHDGTPSERTVWVGGVPHEVPPQAFDGLRGVGGLRFNAEATRARRERMVIASSDYEQPFGTFSGELPVAGAVDVGWGVMERHDVRW